MVYIHVTVTWIHLMWHITWRENDIAICILTMIHSHSEQILLTRLLMFCIIEINMHANTPVTYLKNSKLRNQAVFLRIYLPYHIIKKNIYCCTIKLFLISIWFFFSLSSLDIYQFQNFSFFYFIYWINLITYFNKFSNNILT